MSSQIKSDCRFLLVNWVSLTLTPASSSWKGPPINSPPMSWTHRIGRGYRKSQHCWNFLLTCWDSLESIRIISKIFVSVSMHVRALNIQTLPLTLIFQGPIRSMATSFQGVTLMFVYWKLVLLEMFAFVFVNSVAQLRVIITLYECFSKTFFTGMAKYLVKPRYC